jgi:hypothetical protein
MGHAAVAISLTASERRELESLARAQKTGQAMARRARIELAAAAGMDNYATHKTKPVRDWLAKRPRWHVHFTPTGASCINQVEHFFALITDKQIMRGVHRSTHQLEQDIRDVIEAHNADPKPFRWTKSADDILASIQRFCQRTLQIEGITESGH